MDPPFAGLTNAKQIRDLVIWLATGAISGAAKLRVQQIHKIVCPPGDQSEHTLNQRIDETPIMKYIEPVQKSVS